MTADFPSLVVERFAPLLATYGFRVLEEDGSRVVLESESLRCEVAFDPRGELDVTLALAGERPWEGWSYVGMTGSADVERLLEIALERMEEDPRVLAGDPALFEEMARQRRGDVERYGAWAQGQHVNRREHRLP